MVDVLALLNQMRAASGEAETVGLPDSVILDFASRDSTIVRAIEEASSKQINFHQMN